MKKFPLAHPITLYLVFSLLAQCYSVHGSATERLMISGTGNDDTVDWEFKVNGGRNSDTWSTIPVPSNWEMQGFGTYHYWEDWNETPAPDSLGQYRYPFDIPASWKGKQVSIVFGAVMTDTEVRINGKSAGKLHQGGFYQFSYDITSLLNYGKQNLLEVDVHKYSSNTSVNLAEREADYWLFGGIFRPVWLEAKPVAHIERFAVHARHDGNYSVQISTAGIQQNNFSLTAEILSLEGELINKSKPVAIIAGTAVTELQGFAEGITPWSAEWPHLYNLRVTLHDGKKEIHSMESTIGFRTVDLRPKDGFYLNGQKIQLRGSNRHTIWPDSGRTTNARLSEQDVRLMKEMNMNAVRMSHYPPDSHFLDACDRLGLYVIDELGGWQKSYDSEVGPNLVREMVTRDVNHASIILWSNGNEGGWNTDLDDDFAQYDPQNRPVIHPWHNFGGINTSHYENYDSGPNWFFHGDDLIMPTEFLHGLYDGGHGAGLDDWWKRIQTHPMGLGGFLWAFADEGVVRDDMDGTIDVAGNRAPDGIVGPYREKEGSFFTIKEIWAPIYLPKTELDTLPSTFDGRLRIENRFSFTNLNQLSFEWKLIRFKGTTLANTKRKTLVSGKLKGPEVSPGFDGYLQVELPDHWFQHDSLELTAFYPDGREIYTWSWMLKNSASIASRFFVEGSKKTSVETSANAFVLKNGAHKAVINRESGMLGEFSSDQIISPIKHGPILLTGESNLKSINAEDHKIEASYDGAMKSVTWELLDSGWLKLSYSSFYRHFEPVDYFGVSFKFDETKIDAVRWLGKGPYRVWKNRKKGVEFNIWEKDYNDTATGASWDYPEFKGFHDNVYWAQFHDETSPLDIIIATDGINLRWFTPRETDDPANTHVEFPTGDISFLHSIIPIGTKFKPATMHGPAGQPSWPHRGGQTFSATIYLKIGEASSGSTQE